jgi:F0F1-type ATP synthase membrane subunit a
LFVVFILFLKGLGDETLVVATPDHGEAFEGTILFMLLCYILFGFFQEYHTRNLLHKNEIFQENVRTFMAFFSRFSEKTKTEKQNIVSFFFFCFFFFFINSNERILLTLGIYFLL